MKCYCVETNDKFTYYVENIEPEYIKNFEEDAWWKREGGKFIKEYQNNFENKEIIKANFQKLGESMFRNEGNWEKSLEIFAGKCSVENIEWHVTGSTSEAILGVKIIPHDIDIIVNESDFYKTRDLFLEYLIEPFVDTNGWLVKYFGKICIEGKLFDIVADKKVFKYFNDYENILWKNYKTKIEPVKKRYEIEIQRNRVERVEKIKEYMMENGKK
jgi:hypothetical protein